MADAVLEVRALAQIERATITFGDLTLLIGPQATGKSIVLQLLKLAVDSGRIAGTLKENGFRWKDREEFLSVYFGEGMQGAWSPSTSVTFDGKAVAVPPRRITRDEPRLFYIPAHRTLSVAEGWPAGFRSYKPDTPFVVRDFSERLLRLLTTKLEQEDDVVFPQKRRLKKPVRELVNAAVFHGGRLELVSDGPRRQFKIVYPDSEIAYMAWTAGQREFIPLLLGIYHLVPMGSGGGRAGSLDWVVIEEPEMGLHPKAIEAVMLLILELLGRGYRVALSSHSTAVAEIVWALQELKAAGAKPAALSKLFEIGKTRWDLDDLSARILRKSYQVFHLDYEGDRVSSAAIQRLDPGSENLRERHWGGLTSLSARVNAAVAAAQEDK